MMNVARAGSSVARNASLARKNRATITIWILIKVAIDIGEERTAYTGSGAEDEPLAPAASETSTDPEM